MADIVVPVVADPVKARLKTAKADIDRLPPIASVNNIAVLRQRVATLEATLSDLLDYLRLV